MRAITVTREVHIPDPIRIQRCMRLPELGPKILFFSGGSALKGFSEVLKSYTHNSIHLLTPFDSGGSSAKLRKSFDMPAVGDIRSRLMALADESISGNPEVYRLARYRLSETKSPRALLVELNSLTAGEHKLVKAIPNPLRRLIRLQLEFFTEQMPVDFDLRGASIGNLILTGGYLNYQRHLDPILYLFSKLLAVRGVVRATTSASLHLVAELENGDKIIGQHQFTGKECSPISSPIKRLSLSHSCQSDKPRTVDLKDKVRGLIMGADMICYPPGSFYSSLIANLLPAGVGKAIASSACPKIYIPNLAEDPEQIGLDLASSISTLLSYLKLDAGENVPDNQLVNYVLLDSSQAGTHVEPSAKWLKKIGICVIDVPLVTPESAPFYDDQLLVQALLSLS